MLVLRIPTTESPVSSCHVRRLKYRNILHQKLDLVVNCSQFSSTLAVRMECVRSPEDLRNSSRLQTEICKGMAKTWRLASHSAHLQRKAQEKSQDVWKVLPLRRLPTNASHQKLVGNGNTVARTGGSTRKRDHVGGNRA